MSGPGGVEVIRKRQQRSEESVDRIRERHDNEPDWRGVCQFCKKTLRGTAAELMAHSCPEFEASLG
jgi:hypothetical protein